MDAELTAAPALVAGAARPEEHPPIDVAAALRHLDVDGFQVFREFFPRDQVEQARREILACIEEDLREREEKQVTEAWHRGSKVTTVLTRPTHLVLDAYAQSPVLDRMVERILTDEGTAAVLRGLVGEHIKFRGYNVQRLTGRADPRPAIGAAPNPHEWHRDSPGEIGIAIFLEDVPDFGGGATSIVAGSHHFPYCPRWHSLLGPPYLLKGGKSGLGAFLRLNVFSRLLAWRFVKPAETGAYGRQGDFYIFINDLWHGREPNAEGRSGIKVMIGAFSADDPFPDEVPVPDEAILRRLPPLLRRAAAHERPSVLPSTAGTLIKQLRRQRRPLGIPGVLFHLARWERRLADWISYRARAIR